MIAKRAGTGRRSAMDKDLTRRIAAGILVCMKSGIKSGIFATFALDGGEAHKTLTHLRELGYDCADLQTFVNTETEWFDLPSAERLRRWEDVGKAARDCGISFSQTHGPWRYPPRDSTEEERAERFDKMAVALEGTAAVGAPCMKSALTVPCRLKRTSAGNFPPRSARNGRRRWPRRRAILRCEAGPA